jgi:pyridoxal phosphate enzyme (YggS family)
MAKPSDRMDPRGPNGGGDAPSGYEALRAEIHRIKPEARLIAVSKGQSEAKIRDLYARGQREFGENYFQELEAKAAALADLKDLRWIFIGQLQSNKIQRIVRLAAEIQTAASEKHLRYIDRYAAEAGKVPYPVYIEVNAGDESTKAGVAVDEALALVQAGKTMPNLEIEGLMAIPPGDVVDPGLYALLRQLADQAGNGKLSLGMSGDYREALAAGSDCVRIGRSLFGARQY